MIEIPVFSRLEKFLISLCTTVALLVAMGLWADGNGYERAEKEAQAREAAIITLVRNQERNEAARRLAIERKQRADDQAAFDQYRKDQANATDHKNALISDLQRDVKRLRVPVTNRPVCEGAAVQAGPAAGGAGAEGYAELTPDAGEFLVNLLARGDNAIRKHNETVDRYERLRLACIEATSEKADK